MTSTPSPSPRPGPAPTPQTSNSLPGATEPIATGPGATQPSTPARHAAPAEPSLGELVTDITKQMQGLVHAEVELAKLELRSTVKNAGTGVGAFLAAAVVLVFSLTFGFLALAEGINALGLQRWLSFLIVFGFQLLAVGALVFLGIRKVKAVRAPERTISTTKETVDYLKNARG